MAKVLSVMADQFAGNGPGFVFEIFMAVTVEPPPPFPLRVSVTEALLI